MLPTHSTPELSDGSEGNCFAVGTAAFTKAVEEFGPRDGNGFSPGWSEGGLLRQDLEAWMETLQTTDVIQLGTVGLVGTP